LLSLLPSQQPVHCLLSFAGGREDGAVVVFEDSEPILDIRSIISPWLRLKLQLSRQKSISKLSYEFLERIHFGTEPISQLAIAARKVPGRVNCLMSKRGIKVIRLFKQRERGHVNFIGL
jgi:hypothetical protein